MGRYPRTARSAQFKCISCNAPVVETVDGEYACVDCGDAPIKHRSGNVTTGANHAKSAAMND